MRNILFAPWRKKYVLSKSKKKRQTCFLCDYANCIEKDEENLVLYRGTYCFILMNKYPYNPGHLMIAPYRHVLNINELSEDELNEMFFLIKESINILNDVYKPDGFNIGANIGKAAGAGEEHLHFHVVPRWKGDTNFMPVIADTKVISENLKSAYDTLKNKFKEI